MGRPFRTPRSDTLNRSISVRSPLGMVLLTATGACRRVSPTGAALHVEPALGSHSQRAVRLAAERVALVAWRAVRAVVVVARLAVVVVLVADRRAEVAVALAPYLAVFTVLVAPFLAVRRVA